MSSNDVPYFDRIIFVVTPFSIELPLFNWGFFHGNLFKKSSLSGNIYVQNPAVSAVW